MDCQFCYARSSLYWPRTINLFSLSLLTAHPYSMMDALFHKSNGGQGGGASIFMTKASAALECALGGMPGLMELPDCLLESMSNQPACHSGWQPLGLSCIIPRITDWLLIDATAVAMMPLASHVMVAAACTCCMAPCCNTNAHGTHCKPARPLAVCSTMWPQAPFSDAALLYAACMHCRLRLQA